MSSFGCLSLEAIGVACLCCLPAYWPALFPDFPPAEPLYLPRKTYSLPDNDPYIPPDLEDAPEHNLAYESLQGHEDTSKFACAGQGHLSVEGHGIAACGEGAFDTAEYKAYSDLRSGSESSYYDDDEVPDYRFYRDMDDDDTVLEGTTGLLEVFSSEGRDDLVLDPEALPGITWSAYGWCWCAQNWSNPNTNLMASTVDH